MFEDYNLDLHSIDKKKKRDDKRYLLKYDIVGKTFLLRIFVVYIIAGIFVTLYFAKNNNRSYISLNGYHNNFKILYTVIAYIVGNIVSILYALNKKI